MEVIEIKEDEFDSVVLGADEKVIVDFYANWCGPCKMLRPILEEIANESDGKKFVSINVDEADNLSRTYNISSIPCIVLFQNGNEVSRSIGLKSKDELKAFIGE